MGPATVISRLRARDRSLLDWVLAGGLCLFGQLDLWIAVGTSTTSVHGPRVSAALYIAAATLPLGFRRRWPFGVQCAVMAAIALDSILVGKAPQGILVLFPVLITMYNVAAHAALRTALAGFAVGFAGTLIEVSLDPEVVTFDQLVLVEGTFFVTLGGLAWFVGRYVRARRLAAERSEDRALRIEREQHELAREAVDQERGRIARELHDVIAHSVSLMGVQAGAVERILERDPETARATLRSIQSTARESVAELRRMLGMLRADEEVPGLHPQPGLDALEALVEESRRVGVDVDLNVEGEARPLPPGIELSAYRVAQEALTNVRKHAPGASAELLLRYSTHALEVCVQNTAPAQNGGNHGAPGMSTQHGIVGMRERIAIYGGALETRPLSDGGFLVRARLPIETAT